MIQVGCRVKQLCKKKGISVATLERMANIPEKSISKWDSSNPSFDKFQRVLDALEISYEEFMNMGSPETQKIQTALVKIKAASPELYNDIMRKWISTYEDEKNPATLSDGKVDELYLALTKASDDQREMIKRILTYSPQQVSAFLLMTQSPASDQ